MRTHDNHEENESFILHLTAVFSFGRNGSKRNARSLLALLLKPFPIFRANITLFEKPSFTCGSKAKLSLLKYSGALDTALL